MTSRAEVAIVATLELHGSAAIATVSSSLPASRGAVPPDAVLRAGPQARRDSPVAVPLRVLDARAEPVSFQGEAAAERAALPAEAPHVLAQLASARFVACAQQVELGGLLAGRAQASLVENASAVLAAAPHGQAP
jgi:hypothetical protein